MSQAVTTPYTEAEKAFEEAYEGYLRTLDKYTAMCLQDPMGENLDHVIRLARTAERAAVAREQEAQP